MISFRQVPSESEAQWEAFLQGLYQRGLGGNRLRLITTDGCAGLHRALDMVYPYVPRQRCWAHKLRHVAAKLPRKHQGASLGEAKGIYLAHTRREAITRFRGWAACWRKTWRSYCPSWTALKLTGRRCAPPTPSNGPFQGRGGATQDKAHELFPKPCQRGANHLWCHQPLKYLLGG